MRHPQVNQTVNEQATPSSRRHSSLWTSELLTKLAREADEVPGEVSVCSAAGFGRNGSFYGGHRFDSGEKRTRKILNGYRDVQ